MKRPYAYKTLSFPVLFSVISAIVFIIVALRSYLVPFNHDETATFFFFIQSGNYMPFYSAADANNHILNSFLGNLCFHLFGASPFSLRIPNLVGLIILIFGTYKISSYLNFFGSKILLTSGFLLSFHWISFFSACRGYGLSLALLVMGVSLMLEFIANPINKSKYLWSLLLFQLAISSNLILIIVVLLLSGIMIVIQIMNKKFLNPLTIGAWLLHFSAICYWLTFSFYLQDSGALYYGEGDSYWSVTFATLIQLLVGGYTSIVKWVLIGIVLATIVSFLIVNRKHLLNIRHQFKKPDYSILFFVVLWSLVLGFYLMNKLFGVNFPEDRTGLFFYLFFVLLLCFTIDKFSVSLNQIVGFGFAGFLVFHFFSNINFRKHSLNVYETIPEHFYTTLLNEQKKSPERITIGGHRVRELFYGFFNYRYDGILNPADPTEVMQMNCDYYIATKQEEKYFKEYYDIIDSEPDWGFVLLKRKDKLRRLEGLKVEDFEIIDNNNEFIEIYGKNDTIFSNTNPLLAEIDFDIEKIPVPNNVWFVFQINDSLDQTIYFKRYPLQWSGYNLNRRKHMSYSLVTGNLPFKSKKMVCFFWNLYMVPISINVNSLKIHQLYGKGVDYQAPDIK
jgi:hypothetical protein